MSQLTGTTVTAAVVPNNSKDEIAAGVDNYTKGGLHSYAKLNDSTDPELPFNSLYTIPLVRRSWGMLATVWNDTTNNGFYQLVRGLASTDLEDNDNWQIFSPGLERPLRQILVSDALVNAPPTGNYAVVHYNIEEDATPTGFPAATGSGKTYHIFNINGLLDDFGGWITIENVNGRDEDIAPGNDLKIYDYGVNDYLKV
jgi:hypothetical protein